METPYGRMTLTEMMAFFNKMTAEEARRFFEQYMEAKEGRLQHLRQQFQATGGGAADVLDLSPQSLVPLWVWAVKNVHRRPYTPEELAGIMAVASNLARDEQLRTSPLSEDTLCLSNDIGYYLGDVCVRNLPGVRWDVCITDIEYYDDNNQPVLKGLTLESRNPFQTVAAIARKTANGQADDDDLLHAYRNWSKFVIKGDNGGRKGRSRSDRRTVTERDHHPSGIECGLVQVVPAEVAASKDPEWFLKRQVPEMDGLDVGQAWHCLHYLLTSFAESATPPLDLFNVAIHLLQRRRTEVRSPKDEVPSWATIDDVQVRELHHALQRITDATLRQRFDPNRMASLQVFCADYVQQHPESEWEYLSTLFHDMKSFVAETASKKKGLLVEAS
jgi:hypothetical protein